MSVSLRPFYWVPLLLACSVVVWAKPLWAHAVLERSDPPANAALERAPAEIRLWFTEPLEPKFSRITLRDLTGTTVTVPASQVDAADTHQMFVQPGELADSLYTVVYTVVSAADGHHTEGSFPFTIGASTSALPTATVTRESLSGDSALVRWLNLLGLMLGVGSLGFLCFVWQLAMPHRWPEIEHRLARIVWVGWMWLGLGSVLMLLLQTATVTSRSLVAAFDPALLTEVVRNTRFGSLWVARLVLWLCMGGVLWLGCDKRTLRWLGLALGGAILLVHSLYSHAAAVPEALPAIASDWVHLAMTALWLGGLVQFFGIIKLLHRNVQPVAPVLSSLVGYFSNYARIAVASLVVTGLYAMWLHVGSVEGLLTTLYGRTLLAKLLLLMPMLIIAGLNLVLTHRRLQAGKAIWAGRLRNLIGAELVLGMGVLVTVGVMTSINPARGVLAQRAAETRLTAVPTPNPIEAMQVMDDLHVMLSIAPGWVGENTFRVDLMTLQGEPVINASLIRMRFEHQSENLGESELRITEGKHGRYSVQGANLSAPGAWQIRMTVQRPEQFDVVVDFTPQVELPPPPPAQGVVVPAPLPYRTPVLLGIGLLALALGGYFLGQQRFRFWQGTGVLAGVLVLLGSVFLASVVL
jgi:copper transport protein